VRLECEVMRGGEWVVEWKVDGELIRREWEGHVNGVVKRRKLE
jgi:hypothetical protein